ncbi:helix-turn-helix transcriptional regulator, partial [Candidatus Bathyarchaeota archaeon]|nr:helix-turn-helix transcriptional regulator [Candidatus Bathyarchaeota archaeon]
MLDKDEKLVFEIKRRFIERLVSNFLDVIVLRHFRNDSFSGYDVLLFIRDRFNMLLSSGTVYSKLYSMEREGLVEVVSTGRKRIYRLTELEKLVADVATSSSEIKMFM